MIKNNGIKIIFSILCFIVPFLFYYFTKASALGFADAAEFALVTKIAGIAHAPGFPSYVVLGWLWGKIAGLFTEDHILSMMLFSIICMSAAINILFITLNKILSQNNSPVNSQIASAGAALSFAFGTTVVYWSNSVEVYAFHVLAMSLVLAGLTYYHFNRNFLSLIIAATGIGMGLANHHLTMILFLPFTPLFFSGNLFYPKHEIKTDKKKKIKQNGESFLTEYFKILWRKDFLRLAGTSFTVTFIFYLWMFIRAQEVFPFEFGNPDSLSRITYHLAGGAWMKNTAASVDGLIGLRLPYFLNLTFYHFLFFIPFFIVGLYFFFRQKLFKLLFATLGYFLIIFFYQLRIDQTADTDAYMLLPFFMCSIPLAFGISSAINKYKFIGYLLPFILIVQVLFIYPRVDKSNYNVSSSLMAELDKAAPQGSIIMIADWTTVIQYFYERIVNNFRPDLVVLNYDIKFTNYEMLPALYPELYKKIKPEYDDFINKLGKNNPQEIYHTGTTLTTPELMGAYAAIIHKLRKIAEVENSYFLTDPKAFVFLVQQKVIPDQLIPAGPFVANRSTGTGDQFVYLDYRWLHTEVLLHDPAASDKLVDMEAALDFHKRYYKATRNNQKLQAATQNYNRIKFLQGKMKENMPFLFRPGN